MLTDQELNEKISNKRLVLVGDIEIPHNGEIKDNRISKYVYRDYCGSWQWAGELLDDMANTKENQSELSPEIKYLDGIKMWKIYLFGRHQFVSEKLTRAIAEAWYEVNK